MKIPNTSRNTFTSSSRAIGPSPSCTIHSEIACGTFSVVRTHANALLAATMISTDEVRIAVRDSSTGTIFHCSVR